MKRFVRWHLRQWFLLTSLLGLNIRLGDRIGEVLAASWEIVGYIDLRGFW